MSILFRILCFVLFLCLTISANAQMQRTDSTKSVFPVTKTASKGSKTTGEINTVSKVGEKPLDDSKGEKGGFFSFDVLNFIVASLALIASCVAVFYTHKQFGRDSGIRSLEFVSEIDKMIVENPYLWHIYDDNKHRFPINDTVQKLELEGKLEAFCYYCINNFELVILRNKEEGLQLFAWKSYMIYTIVHSSLFKKLVKDSITDFFYSSDFQDLLKELLATSELVEIHYKKYCLKEIDREAYNKLAKETIKAELDKLKVNWWKRWSPKAFRH